IATKIARDHLVGVAIERDETLGIVGFRVARFRSGRPAEVPEAPQPLARLGALCNPRWTTIGTPKPIERCAQAPDICGSCSDEIVRFGLIVGEVVQRWNWQVDVLQWPVDDTGERCPAAIERRGQRFEIQRGATPLTRYDR